jgi:hypothetical protein
METISGEKPGMVSGDEHRKMEGVDIGADKPPVQIRLQVLKKKDHSVITNTTLNLTWFDRDIAHVNYSFKG